MFRIAAIALGLSLIGGPAPAEIVSRTADGFTLHFAVDLETPPEDVIVSVGKIPEWWDPAHSYTGDAANLSLAFEPGGCWCESLADGARFEHGRVVRIGPTRVVFDAPLGPLHATATRSDLTFSVDPEDRGWRVAMDFVVEGPGLGALADPVNGVMDGAFDRFVHQLTHRGSAAP